MTYGIWLGRARRAGPVPEAFAFRTVLAIDSRLVTPAFLWQVVSGLLLVFVYDLAVIDEPWLSASLGIYGVVALVAFTVVAPRARRAARALEQDGPGSPVYTSYRRLMKPLTPLIAVGTIVIVVLMVTKPGR